MVPVWDIIDRHFMSYRDLNIEQRKFLVNALVSQYDSIGEERYLLGFINLKKRVYSVTTGHQLCFMGGPVFLFIK